MGTDQNITFVPILTVLAEYGNAPFLWLVERPGQGGVGPNWCDGTYWSDSYPMSEGLWRKFADWVMEFELMEFYLERPDDDDWDWLAFNARGMQLSRWLKEEVGSAYRVVYLKPTEDPNSRIQQRIEIAADGTLLSLPPFESPFAPPPRFCEHIISGGQMGADRAALDFAIKHGYTHGGWIVCGRLAEDGFVPAKYQLMELATASYRARTRRNVEGSDATLIVNLGELDGGTQATQVFAVNLGKPCLVVQIDHGISQLAVESTVAWLREHQPKTLNVAGPRESKRPGIYRLTSELLLAMDASLLQSH